MKAIHLLSPETRKLAEELMSARRALREAKRALLDHLGREAQEGDPVGDDLYLMYQALTGDFD